VRKRALSPPPAPEQKVFGLLARAPQQFCVRFATKLVTINHVSKGAKKLAARSRYSLGLCCWQEKINLSQARAAHPRTRL